MNTLTVDIFVSVDGWARGVASPGYFGYLGPELEQWISAELDRPQTVILGRRTYEALANVPEPARDEGWRRMAELDKVVFSRTLTEAVWPNTRICEADMASEIGSMKATGDAPLRTMGSLSLARQLLEAGLLDRLRLMTFPLIVGDGGREPFFEAMPAADLKLVGHQVLDGRILLSEYHPTGKDIPRI